MNENSSNSLLNAALLGELNAVNQTFMHALLLNHLRWEGPAEDAYEFAVAAMNRAMRLILAMQADNRKIAFGSAPLSRDLAGVNVQAAPDRIFEADRQRLAGVVGYYRSIVAQRASDVEAYLAVIEQSLREAEAHIATLDSPTRYGPAADEKGRTELSELRKHSESYNDAWRHFGRDSAARPDASGSGIDWVGELLSALLPFLAQTFVHGFIHRHANRQGLANLVFARSIDDMRFAYMLTSLALERVGAVTNWLPSPQISAPNVECECQKMLANDRTHSLELAALTNRSMHGANGDPAAVAILNDLRRVQEAFVRSLSAVAENDAGSRDTAKSDQIAAMLARWGIERFPSGDPCG
jgi:bacterioferritin (cytochrome b1)